MRRGRRHDPELAPDEIFLDSTNVSDLDTNQLEGRIEQPLRSGVFVGTIVAISIFTILLVFQAMRLEVIHGAEYALKSDHNHLRPAVLFAKRGAILDRNGTIIVANREDPEKGMMREYKTPGFAHLTGYVSYPKKDSSGHYYETVTTGLTGIEATFNDTLGGKNGRLLVEEDANGNVRSEGTIDRPEDGKPLTLSIDARIQEAFYTSIKNAADENGYQGGTGIVMDVHTGEILALVSYPEYDPNILSQGSPRNIIAGYNTNPRLPYLNRAISGLFTPGSTVKTAIAAGALTDHIITPDTIIVSHGSISIPNPYDALHPTVFPDWKALGALNVRGAIAHSSDVFFYTVGGGFENMKGLGIDRLDYWYRTFGFASTTGIELAGEGTGLVPSPAWKMEKYGQPWRIGDTYHTSIGQYAMQLTPLEILRAAAAIANGGTLVKPTIIKGTPPSGEKLPIDDSALQVVREGMRQTVTDAGTASALNTILFTHLAAKTGTAQLGTHNEFINAWDVAFFPYENPKYAFVVLMNQGPSTGKIGAVLPSLNALNEIHKTAPEYFEQ